MTVKETAPRLGRGLAALLGDTVSPEPSAIGLRQIPLDLLDAGPFQPRAMLDQTGLQELADSIRARGVLQPLLARHSPVTPGRFQIVAGERRWRAATLAGLHEIPVLVRDLADADALAVGLIENLQRQDLNAIEEAEGYSRLLDEFGMTQEDLARGVGKSRAHVSNTLRLLKLPGGVRAALTDGRVSAGHARALLAHRSPETALQQVLAAGLSVRQTEALAARDARQGADPGTKIRDPDTLALERELSEQIGLRVEIGGKPNAGVLRIHFRSLEQLDSVVALLGARARQAP